MKSLFTPYYQGLRISAKFIVATQLIMLGVVWAFLPTSTGVPGPQQILTAWDANIQQNPAYWPTVHEVREAFMLL